jgi:type II secretory pathway pseudopilin PulG
VDRRGFSLIDVLVAVSLFALVAGLSLLALYKVEGARRAYAKEAVIRQVLLWYADRQAISSSFSWSVIENELHPRNASTFDPSNPITPLVTQISRYYPNRVYAVLDTAPVENTHYIAITTSAGGYRLETRTNRIALRLGPNGPYIFTLGNDLFSYQGQIPLKSFVAVP